MPVVEIARDAFVHELQHLCFRANQGTGWFPTVYASTDETLSTCAEYMWKAWEVVAPNTYDQSYDSSVFRCERCDLYEKYYVEQLWVGYLYDALKGDPADPTDDVVYKWLRYRDAGGKMEITMNSLAEVLADPSYWWVGGTTGAERLQNVFRNFLVAKFCDAPGFGSDSRYGYVDLDPVGDLGFFKDLNAWYDTLATPQTPVDCPAPSKVCPDYPAPVPAGHAGYWNVRILPPSYSLGDWSEGVMDTVSGIYKDGDDTPTDPNDGDSSRDYIDLALWGTDYIIFRAGSYYQDGHEHMLKFWLSGDDSVAANTAVLGSVIGYGSDEEMLQQHPENILFIEPLEVEPGTAHAEISLADFGRSVKAVVVALAYVETDPQTRVLEDAPYFAYTYAYGVVTPEIDALLPGERHTSRPARYRRGGLSAGRRRRSGDRRRP